MAMSCPRCNAQILDTQRFCRFCGYRLDQGIQDYTNTALFDPPIATGNETVDRHDRVAPWMQSITPVRGIPCRRTLVRRLVPIVMVIVALNVGGFLVRQGIRRARSGAVSVIQFGRGSTSSGPAYLGVHLGDGQGGGAFIDGAGPPDGPAVQAGLIGGDLIVQADDTPIHSSDDMRKFLRTKEPGDDIRVEYLRDDQLMSTMLTAGSSDDVGSESEPVRPRGFFGINDDGTRVHVPNRPIYGVRINSLVRNGPADLAGAKQGDIIVDFNGHPIRTYRELTRRIRETEARSLVDVRVIRDQEELVIPVKLGER